MCPDCCVALSHGAMGLSAVWSYSLTIFHIQYAVWKLTLNSTSFLTVQWSQGVSCQAGHILSTCLVACRSEPSIDTIQFTIV